MREAALIIHFIGLAMGVGTSFAFMFIGMRAQKLDPADRGPFMVNVLSALPKMGHIGLTLLLISGLYLIMPYHKAIMEMPLFLSKLVLFLVLGALIGIMSSKGKKVVAGDLSQMPAIAKLGQVNVIVGLAIVILAVLQFQ